MKPLRSVLSSSIIRFTSSSDVLDWRAFMTDTSSVIEILPSPLVSNSFQPHKRESESEKDILDEGDEETDREHDQEPEVSVQPEPVVNKAPEVFSAPKEATRENCSFLFSSNFILHLSQILWLFKVKEKQREITENTNGRGAVKKHTAGELRLHKDISELNLPESCTISFPNGKDELMNFEVSIRPDEGYYLQSFTNLAFNAQVYHPNIDLEGNVCLNILREDWKPVLNINTIVYGLYHLFTEPNHEDPLNHDAAAVLRDNPKTFQSNVRKAMTGGYVGQTHFARSCMWSLWAIHMESQVRSNSIIYILRTFNNPYLLSGYWPESRGERDSKIRSIKILWQKPICPSLRKNEQLN
ncbi:hypothetical protein TEA_012150 [Camellia sinensis var. sinensis]|uniref:UBC core domain-containing protein n=1 Tax=Camellia sinensis var. sinensis TaxID=542762 RepID=A0A4S4DPD6_CAMSN|nr:hypothetical protein TEA_012150 [Camellia sinensis var. sinensis]